MPAPRKTSQPGLVEHLADQAKRKPVNSLLGVSKYYTSADLLLRQADSYRKGGNEEQQYVMLMRFASLLLETIPEHKDFDKRDAKYIQLKRALVETCFPQLEALKLSLKAREIVEPHAHSRNRPADAVMLATSNLPSINWGDASTALVPTAAHYAYDPSQVRVDDLLDIIQNGSGPSAPPPPPPSSAPRDIATASYDSYLSQPTYQSKYAVSGTNRHTLFNHPSSSSASYSNSLPPSRDHMAYPQGPYDPSGLQGRSFSSGGGPSLSPYPQLEAFQQLSIQQQLPPTAGPSLGPQEIGVITIPADMQGLPDTCTHHGQPPQHAYPSAPALPPPVSHQGTAQPPPPPPSAGDRSGGVQELAKKAGLRDVHVSVALMEDFLAYARANTQAGIESCGILAGRLSANDSMFTICTLIIPKQQGTTDTVQALNEEEIFEVQFSQELYPLGWIHTHPTQTCFLSSVDVHTQCGYQTMLDEAVAIVMAPTDRTKKCGIFRLSTPGGLQLVQKCNLRGFHAHPDTSTGQELYELCGHVYLHSKVKHTVIDLR